MELIHYINDERGKLLGTADPRTAPNGARYNATSFHRIGELYIRWEVDANDDPVSIAAFAAGAEVDAMLSALPQTVTGN